MQSIMYELSLKLMCWYMMDSKKKELLIPKERQLLM